MVVTCDICNLVLYEAGPKPVQTEIKSSKFATFFVCPISDVEAIVLRFRGSRYQWIMLMRFCSFIRLTK